MNTAFHYLYRDGFNCKKASMVVFSGSITPQLHKMLIAALDEQSYFVADQLRVPEVFFNYGDDCAESDHCWHEFSGLEATSDPVTDSRTIEQFVADVIDASSHGWRSFEQVNGRRTGLPADSL